MNEREPRLTNLNNNSTLGGAASMEEQAVPTESERLNALFNNGYLIDQLKSETPDFSNTRIADFKNFIEHELSPTSPQYLHFANIMLPGVGTTSRNINGTNVEISEVSQKLVFEWLLERIISLPDKGPEDAQYSIGSYQTQQVVDELLFLAQSRLNAHDYQYMAELKHVREQAHNLNISFKFGESYKKYLTEVGGISSEGLNFMQNEVVGVGMVLRLYEKIAAQKVAETKTWFSAKDVYDVSLEVEQIFDKLYQEDVLQQNGRKLTGWEVDRAKRIGKIMFSGTQRMAVYIGLGNLPTEGTTRIASLPGEFIERALYDFKLGALRFFGDSSGSKAFMTRIFANMLKSDEKDKKYVELFGLDKRTIMSNELGAPDPESHGWRSELMFLGNLRLKAGQGEMNLIDFLNYKARAFGKKEDNVFSVGSVSEGKREGFSKEVENEVLGQRLYLSILVRNQNFSQELKTKLWKKIATLKPSTLVALMPDVVEPGERATWNLLKQKLYIAEEKRVIEDGKGLTKTVGELATEADSFNEMTDDTKYQLIRKYCYDQNFSEEEINLLKRIIDRGHEKAEELAKAKMFHTYCIDDAPEIAWNKRSSGIGISDEDIKRIFVSDQGHLAEGWNEINTLVETPYDKPAEHLAKAVESLGSVFGRSHAQGLIAPIIEAYVDMAATDKKAEWIPGMYFLRRSLQMPTSEMEKYFRQSFVSMGSAERAEFLLGLSQLKVISDSPEDAKNGMTKLDELRKKTKSTKIKVFIESLRILIFLLGPTAVYEMLTSIIPNLDKV